LKPNFTTNASLVDVAMGRQQADLVVRGGRWVCVQSGEIIPNTDIAIKDSRIAYVGPDASHTIGAVTRIIAADDRYLVPGLLDAHMHVESGMLTISEFVRAVLPHGTTGMFIDPHEIANVFGLKGVQLMVEEAAVQPIHVWVQVPSCVPSVPGLETPGAALEPYEIAKALEWDGVIGLGEVMDFPGVINNQQKMVVEIASAMQSGGVIGGHYASPDLGLPFHGYAAGGPEDDHEGTTLEDALARVRQGMKVMMRFGSAWHDVAAQIKAVTELRLDARNFMLCTDDSHAYTLVNEGHVNRALQVAIAQGVPPITAIQMATINTAIHFGVSKKIGMIAPGRIADILLVKDLPIMKPDTVIAQGVIAVQDGKVLLEKPDFRFPDWARRSINLMRPVTIEDFKLVAPYGNTATAHIIGIIENQAPTRHIKMNLPVSSGEIKVDMARDLAKIALIERHHGTGGVQVGLIHGFGFNVPCAIASTIAHDCHHLLVAGTREDEMVQAVNILVQQGGGQVVVSNGEILGYVPLPIGGIISDQPAHVVASQAAELLAGFRACGCTLNNPNMQFSLAALIVIPELRLSDLGLVDVNQFRIIDVLESEIE
jgi:adenine deaminase